MCLWMHHRNQLRQVRMASIVLFREKQSRWPLRKVTMMDFLPRVIFRLDGALATADEILDCTTIMSMMIYTNSRRLVLGEYFGFLPNGPSHPGKHVLWKCAKRRLIYILNKMSPAKFPGSVIMKLSDKLSSKGFARVRWNEVRYCRFKVLFKIWPFKSSFILHDV